MLERDDIIDDHYDQYLNAEVLLPIRGKCKLKQLLVANVMMMVILR